MRTTLVLALLALALPSASAGAPAERPRSHVRPLTVGTSRLLADAAARSTIVARLLDDLERTDVVVYLSDSQTQVAPSDPHASLVFLSSGGGLRYVVVWIDRWDVSPCARIAALGHELQHAWEVAQAPEVRDSPSLARLYHRIGWEDRAGRFESDTARAIGHEVLDELAGFPPSERLRQRAEFPSTSVAASQAAGKDSSTAPRLP